MKKAHTQNTIDQINKTRGFTYIDQRDWRGREFVEKCRHGMGKLKKNNDLDEPRELDEALIAQSKEKYTGTMERVKNAFAQKEAGKEIKKKAEDKNVNDKKADKPVRRNSVV